MKDSDFRKAVKAARQRDERGEATDEDRRFIKMDDQAKEDQACPGNSSEPSESSSARTSEPSEKTDPPTARTTAPRSRNERTGSSTARSTGGSGKAGS